MQEGAKQPEMNCQFADITGDVQEWKYDFGEEKQV